MLASGVLCLVSLARGGINNGAGKNEDVDERRSFLVAMEALTERGLSAARRRGLQEEEEDYL